MTPTRVPVAVRLLHPSAELPRYSTDGDAGADLTSVAEVTIAPGERTLVPTGVALALPPGTVGLVHPRSGLAARHGVTVVNAPGTVDSGYRGEVLVNLVNLDPRRAVHRAGRRPDRPARRAGVRPRRLRRGGFASGERAG